VQQVVGNTQEMTQLTVSAAAEILGVDRTTALRLIEAGDLPAINIARTGAARKTWRVDEDELRRWMASRSNTPPETDE
jgi:excisionase family DNA binding protein